MPEAVGLEARVKGSEVLRIRVNESKHTTIYLLPKGIVTGERHTPDVAPPITAKVSNSEHTVIGVQAYQNPTSTYSVGDSKDTCIRVEPALGYRQLVTGK